MKLRPVEAEKVIKALVFKSLDSHVVMKHPDGRITVIPIHRGEELGRGILREIMKDTKISRDEFISILEEVYRLWASMILAFSGGIFRALTTKAFWIIISSGME